MNRWGGSQLEHVTSYSQSLKKSEMLEEHEIYCSSFKLKTIEFTEKSGIREQKGSTE